MTPIEATKKVKAQKPEENYLVIRLGYSDKLVFPYSQGMQVITALNHAEILKDPYTEVTRISPLSKGAFEVYPMSREDYVLTKTANLLDISVEELQGQMKNAKETA